MSYGEPIPPEVVGSCDERELVAEVERRVRQCHAMLREHPAFAGKTMSRTRIPGGLVQHEN